MKSNLIPYICMFLCISATGVSCDNKEAGGYPFPYEREKEAPDPGADFPKTRKLYEWPFDQKSIWNMPIGEEAEYVHAKLEPADAITIDEDYIVLTPSEPLMKVYKNNTGWDGNGDVWNRCYRNELTEVLFEAPIPQSWIVSPDSWDGNTPNAGIAVVKEDGITLIEGQPFAHCVKDASAACSFILHSGHKITGDGIRGAHGGSGLSAIGGALRSHELTPTSGPIRHALKINVCAAKNLYYDGITKGYRWPADRADNYAPNEGSGYGRQRSAEYPVVEECRMGALLALPPTIDVEQLGLKTEPAKIIAKALQDYGAYIVDDTGWVDGGTWNVNAIITEWSPESRFKTEFKKNWGINFEAWNTATGKDREWKTDIDLIFANLHVVVNNAAETVGGPGFRRQPFAPPFE